MVLGALMACLVSAQAQNAQEWQTSTMVGSGSAYSPQVTAVGATTVTTTVTTTESYSPASSGPRRVIGTNPDGGEGSEDSPIGDAMLPLLALAMVYGVGCMVYRRKRRV